MDRGRGPCMYGPVDVGGCSRFKFRVPVGPLQAHAHLFAGDPRGASDREGPRSKAHGGRAPCLPLAPTWWVACVQAHPSGALAPPLLRGSRASEVRSLDRRGRASGRARLFRAVRTGHRPCGGTVRCLRGPARHPSTAVRAGDRDRHGGHALERGRFPSPAGQGHCRGAEGFRARGVGGPDAPRAPTSPCGRGAPKRSRDTLSTSRPQGRDLRLPWRYLAGPTGGAAGTVPPGGA